jgi:predicted transcriptional regulator
MTEHKKDANNSKPVSPANDCKNNEFKAEKSSKAALDAVHKVPIDTLIEDLPWEPIRLDDCEATIESYKQIPVEDRPPITLAYCPLDTSIHGKILDGQLLFDAALANCEENILCRFVEVSDRKEAYRISVERNCKHGKQLSREEKAKAAKKLRDDGLTQTDIAQILGVSQPTVNRFLRPEATATSENSPCSTRRSIIRPIANLSDETSEPDIPSIIQVNNSLSKTEVYKKLGALILFVQKNHSENWAYDFILLLETLIETFRTCNHDDSDNLDESDDSEDDNFAEEASEDEVIIN